MTHIKGIALKPYLESIETHCKKLTKKELLETIRHVAQTVPQEERSNFLHQITQLDEVEIIPSAQMLIDDLLELRKEIEARIASIEDGSYYEKYNAWDEYNDDEGADYISQEQKQALEALFGQTGELFLSNQLEAAKGAFDELFEFQLDDFSLDIDLREPRARYCRCIYETVAPKQQVKALLVGMVPEQSSQFRKPLRLFDGNYPFLQDIIDARPAELPNFKTFLPAWEKALANMQSDRAALLRLEAVYLIKGLEGVAALARKWSKQQPLGYLFWIEKLLEQKAWSDVASISQEGLSALPLGEYRAAVADSLLLAAEALGDLALVLNAKKEKCLSAPNENTLLAWINEADVQQQRSDALKQALKFLSQNKPFASTLYAQTSLMAGEINKAFGLVKNEKAYGWSSGRNPTGVVFAGILIALLPINKQPSSVLQKLLQRYTRTEYFSYSSSEESYPKKESSLIDLIVQGIRRRKWPASQAKKWLEWAENIAKQRVEHIVTNKHRHAYERAAEILGALCEYFILTKKEKHGISLIQDYRNVQFYRFTAFRREVDQVIASSNLLKGIADKI